MFAQEIGLIYAQVVENLSVERNICFVTCSLTLVKNDIRAISAVKHSVEKIIYTNIEKSTVLMDLMNANYVVRIRS